MVTKISFALMMGILLLICPSAVTAASDAVLVLHFDEGSGTVAHDSSGHGNDGAIYGATWVDGITGKALSFDGQNDYISLPDFTSKYNRGTVLIWINQRMQNDATGFIYAEAVRSNNKPYFGLGFQEGNIWFARDVTGTSSNFQGFSSCNANDGLWHLIAWSSDGNINSFYFDGKEVSMRWQDNNIPHGIWFNDQMTNTNTLGWIDRPDMAYYYQGLIDEVAIYPRALSAYEIQSHYLAKRADPTPTPTPPTTLPTTTTPTPTKPAISASLVKSINPQIVKQNQIVTVTVTIENTGTTQLSDIEVIDIVPSEFIFLSGDTKSAYSTLKPGESRIIQYTLQPNGAGKFTLDAATARFADQSGNYSTINSNTPTIEVLTPLLDQPITTNAPGFDAILCIGGIFAAILMLRKLK